MTRERARELAPIIAAYGEGKDIQLFSHPEGWLDLTSVPKWSDGIAFRIKPEPKKRPMTREEVLGFVANTPGIVVRKDEGVWQLPSGWTFYTIQEYQWATIDADGKISGPRAFEVEE